MQQIKYLFHFWVQVYLLTSAVYIFYVISSASLPWFLFSELPHVHLQTLASWSALASTPRNLQAVPVPHTFASEFQDWLSPARDGHMPAVTKLKLSIPYLTIKSNGLFYSFFQGLNCIVRELRHPTGRDLMANFTAHSVRKSKLSSFCNTVILISYFILQKIK